MKTIEMKTIEMKTIEMKTIEMKTVWLRTVVLSLAMLFTGLANAKGNYRCLGSFNHKGQQKVAEIHSTEKGIRKSFSIEYFDDTLWFPRVVKVKCSESSSFFGSLVLRGAGRICGKDFSSINSCVEY